jgi:hypothetical protein
MRAGRPRKGETAFLRSVGISKRLSMQAQAFASLPKEIQEDVAQRRMSLSAAVRLYHLARRVARDASDPRADGERAHEGDQTRGFP